MRILFLGDVLGKTGRKCVAEYLPKVIEQNKIDFVVANGENICHGFGMGQKQSNPLFEVGVDCLTGGNHSFDQRDSYHFIDSDKRVLRPLNFPKNSIGRGFEVYEKNGKNILVISLLGQVFMRSCNSPFDAVSDLLERYELGKNVDIIFVDFHAEATGEKMGMGHFLDGKVSVMAGSHSHIPTADYHIMEHGTGYITDSGMCGDYNSMIGMKKETALHKLVSRIPNGKFEVSEGEATFMGTIFEVADNGLTKSIEQIKIGGYLERN